MIEVRPTFGQARPDTRIALGLILCLSLALGACQTSGARRAGELAELLTWFPGSWEESGPVQSDPARAGPSAGRAPGEAVRIAIVPIDAPLVGHHVFYVQEAAADDPRRLMSQRLLSFESSDHGAIEQTDYSLTDPRRWREAALEPELFTGLQPPDFKKVPGCPLIWRREPDRFTAAIDSVGCGKRMPTAAAPALAVVRAELRRDEYAIARRTAGGAEEPLVRFHKPSAP